MFSAGEDAFLSSVIPQVDGARVVFKLAPTYSLYMALRYRLQRSQASNQPGEKEMRVNRLVEKIAEYIHHTVQVLWFSLIPFYKSLYY